MYRTWTFVENDGTAWTTQGTLLEAIEKYKEEHGELRFVYDVIAIVSH